MSVFLSVTFVFILLLGYAAPIQFIVQSVVETEGPPLEVRGERE